MACTLRVCALVVRWSYWRMMTEKREIHAPGCGCPLPWTVPPDAYKTEAVCACFLDRDTPDPDEDDAGDESVVENGHASVKRRVPRRANAAPPGVLLSTVEPEAVAWLWAGRIPLGKITLIEGDPDKGKSALTTDLSARVSVGREWPDGTPCEAAGVVICNAEDGVADTIRPRLDAAGGDASKVLTLATVPDGEGDRLISIPEDLQVLRRGIERVDAELVIVDPLMAFLSGDVNSHRDQDVRRALAPLAKLADEVGVAVVVVRHLNKASGGSPLYRGGGSIGIVGAARSALLVAEHPEDEDRRVLARVKGNLSQPVPTLAFALTGAANGSVRVEWKGETSHTAAGLLNTPTDPEERSAQTEAVDFLRDALRGGSVWSQQVKKDAKDASISEATLRRAKTSLGVVSEKEADGSWFWRLPDHEAKRLEDALATTDEHLEHVEHLPIDKPDSRSNQGAHVSTLNRQGAQARGSDEHLEESGIDKRDSPGPGEQGAQDVHLLGFEHLDELPDFAENGSRSMSEDVPK